MSFDVFLQACDESGDTALTRADLMSILPLVEDGVGDSLGLDFGGVPYTRFYVSESATTPSTISSICVNRPVADVRLWDGLHEIMERGPMALFFPGSDALYVSNAAHIDRTSKALLGAFGTPVVVLNGDQIIRAIQAT